MLSTFLSARDKFMLEMHLRQLGFTYSTCGPLTKKKEKMQKLKETADLRHIYQNELDKSCFRHDMAYGDFQDLPRKTASDKVLRDKAFNTDKNPKYDEYVHRITSMVSKFFDKKSSDFY